MVSLGVDEMKVSKLLHWFPDPNNRPDLFAEIKYPRKKTEFDKMNIGDYVDLTDKEAQLLLGPVCFAGRFRLVRKEAK